MNIEQEQQWITGEEMGCENRRLIEAGVPDDAPEFQELIARVAARDNDLYERYGKSYLDTHPGKWSFEIPPAKSLGPPAKPLGRGTTRNGNWRSFQDTRCSHKETREWQVD